MNVNVKECQGVQCVQLMSPSVWMSRVRKSEAKWGLIGGSEGRRRRTRPGVHRHLIRTNNEMIGTNNAIIGTNIKLIMGVGGEAFCLVCVWPQIMKTRVLHQKQVIFCQLLESSFPYAAALSQNGQQRHRKLQNIMKRAWKMHFWDLLLWDCHDYGATNRYLRLAWQR